MYSFVNVYQYSEHSFLLYEWPIMRLSSAIVYLNFICDWPVNLQIRALLTKSQYRASNIHVTDKACGRLYKSP